MGFVVTTSVACVLFWITMIRADLFARIAKTITVRGDESSDVNWADVALRLRIVTGAGALLSTVMLIAAAVATIQGRGP